jgi:hypothetical protein
MHAEKRVSQKPEIWRCTPHNRRLRSVCRVYIQIIKPASAVIVTVVSHVGSRYIQSNNKHFMRRAQHPSTHTCTQPNASNDPEPESQKKTYPWLRSLHWLNGRANERTSERRLQETCLHIHRINVSPSTPTDRPTERPIRFEQVYPNQPLNPLAALYQSVDIFAETLLL